MGAGGKQKKELLRFKKLQKARELILVGPDDRGNFLQNRNQRNIVQYNEIVAIDASKNLKHL